MAHYNIFREQLAIKYPEYGHALWEPSPRRPDRPVEVGDVGFIRRGKFHRLFNALLPADDPSHELRVPEDHEQLVPNLLDHIVKDSLTCNHYCSTGISIERELDIHASRPPDDFRRASFRCLRRSGGAVLSLPVKARREDTLALGDFAKWIVTHIDSWLAFTRGLGLGIQQMEEIILVTGFDRTRSWVNIAFSGGQDDARVSFGVKAVDDLDSGINFQFSPEDAQGGLLSQGPEGRICDLPENQCVFVRGYRVARSRWLLPRHLKAAAGPPTDPHGHGSDPGMELLSTPAMTKFRDPLHLLLDYIAEQAPDCDMILVHDDDLGRISGFEAGIPQETFRPDAMMDFQESSNIDIHKVDCDLSSDSSSLFSNAGVVRVAMLSPVLPSRDSPNPVLVLSPLNKGLKCATSPASGLPNAGLKMPQQEMELQADQAPPIDTPVQTVIFWQGEDPDNNQTDAPSSSQQSSISTFSKRGLHSRSRIKVVCAECWRLKLRCDSRNPCGSCIKRDTVELCQYTAAAPMHSRSRVTAACAECKRLKVRCDGRRPCGTCVKRDTVQLCQYTAATAKKGFLPSLAIPKAAGTHDSRNEEGEKHIDDEAENAAELAGGPEIKSDDSDGDDYLFDS